MTPATAQMSDPGRPASAGLPPRQAGRAPPGAPCPARTGRRSGPPPARRPARTAGGSPKASWVADLPAGIRPGGAHPDQAQPGPRVEARRRVQGTGGGVDLPGHVGRLGQRPRPGDRLEVGQPQLHHHRPGHRATGPQAPRRPPGQPEQLPADHLGVVHVGGEGLLRADALVRHPGITGRSSRPQASADRCAPAAWPSSRCSAASGVCAMSPTVRRPSRASDLPGLLPHPPQGGDRQRVQEVEHLRRPGRRAARPACTAADASLATNLQLATPTEQVRPCWSRMLARISSAISVGRPSRRMAPETSRNASSSDSGSTSGVTRPEDRHDLGGHGGVDPVAGRDEDRLRAQPPRPGHRHRRTDPERRGPRRSRKHHPAAAAADDHRLPGEFGLVTDLDAGVEGVHVDVEDVTAGVAASHAGYRYPTTWNWVAMSWKAG